MMHNMRQREVYIIFKPCGMLSQFTREIPGQVTLADLPYTFSRDVYPVGRLDADSEGLLLLTNDTTMNARLLHPSAAHPRTYWVQVEGIPTDEAIGALSRGVDIKIDGRVHHTLPAKVEALPEPPDLPERVPPVRVRKTVPDRWLAITLTEGKNRQVRRMCAAVGFPVLRLVRARIGTLGLGPDGLGRMEPGEVRVVDPRQII
jgi:23S rRNA pseudouridine2457 synthase